MPIYRPVLRALALSCDGHIDAAMTVDMLTAEHLKIEATGYQVIGPIEKAVVDLRIESCQQAYSRAIDFAVFPVLVVISP
jgi:hypothetical protein